ARPCHPQTRVESAAAEAHDAKRRRGTRRGVELAALGDVGAAAATRALDPQRVAAVDRGAGMDHADETRSTAAPLDAHLARDAGTGRAAADGDDAADDKTERGKQCRL